MSAQSFSPLTAYRAQIVQGLLVQLTPTSNVIVMTTQCYVNLNIEGQDLLLQGYEVFTGTTGFFVEDASLDANRVFMASQEWYYLYRDDNGNVLVTYPEDFGSLPRIDMSRIAKNPTSQAAAHQSATATDYTVPALVASPQSIHNQGMATSSSYSMVATPLAVANRPPRPANPFILFRKFLHPVVKAENPGMKNVELSVIIGQLWQQLPLSEKAVWRSKAGKEKEKHQQLYPDYKYAPRKAGEKKRRMTKKKLEAALAAASTSSQLVQGYGDVSGEHTESRVATFPLSEKAFEEFESHNNAIQSSIANPVEASLELLSAASLQQAAAIDTALAYGSSFDPSFSNFFSFDQQGNLATNLTEENFNQLASSLSTQQYNQSYL